MITLTGGAIGQGLPNAVGAAIACPNRPVIAIGDGTTMYTIQALWSMARENLHVVSVIFNNARLLGAGVRHGAGARGRRESGPKAKSQLDLKGPGTQLRPARAGHGRACGAPARPRTSARHGVRALAHPEPRT
ncbi:MAG: thiamine pyrophosphate-dependent enzyme [Inhella sp.]